jgi:hypothetical protein
LSLINRLTGRWKSREISFKKMALWSKLMWVASAPLVLSGSSAQWSATMAPQIAAGWLTLTLTAWCRQPGYSINYPSQAPDFPPWQGSSTWTPSLNMGLSFLNAFGFLTGFTPMEPTRTFMEPILA